MHLARVPGKELPQEVSLKPIPVCPPPAVTDLHDAHSHPGFTRRQHSVHVENPPVPGDAFVLQQIVHALLRSSERNRSSHLQPELDQAADGFGTRGDIVLGPPLVNRRQLQIVPAHADLRAFAGWGGAAPFLWYHTCLCHKTMVPQKQAEGKLELPPRL
jgi:hypothetical protein